MAQNAIVGFDTASTISAAVIKRAQAKSVAFAALYLKWMTPAIIDVVSKSGMNIVTIYETTAKRPLGGTGAGAADGRQARQLAASFGQPVGAAIYAAADWDEVASRDQVTLDYFRAFKAALEGQARLGVYGNGAVCKLTLDAGVADLTWLAGGSGMRGTKEFAASGRATMIQGVGDKAGLALGINIDSDIAMVEDYGGWSTHALTHATTAPVASVTLSDVIATAKLFQEQLTALGYSPGAIDGAIGKRSSDAGMAAWRDYSKEA